MICQIGSSSGEIKMSSTTATTTRGRGLGSWCVRGLHVEEGTMGPLANFRVRAVEAFLGWW